MLNKHIKVCFSAENLIYTYPVCHKKQSFDASELIINHLVVYICSFTYFDYFAEDFLIVETSAKYIRHKENTSESFNPRL